MFKTVAVSTILFGLVLLNSAAGTVNTSLKVTYSAQLTDSLGNPPAVGHST